jgi:hypothetical protein
MNKDQFILDRMNESLTITKNDFKFFTTDCDVFLQTIDFLPQFDDTIIINYEPQRGIYVIENSGGNTFGGINLTEIQWIQNNFDNIVSAAQQSAQNEFVNDLSNVRNIRDIRISLTDWLITRHNEELLFNVSPTLSNDQLQELRGYRQSLRDLEGLDEKYTEEIKQTFVWPQLPSFLGANYIL